MSTHVKHGAAVTRFVVLVAVVTGLGWSSVVLSGPVGTATASDTPAVAPAAEVVPAAQVVIPATDPLTPDPALLSQGDTAPRVRVVQARLRQLGWYAGKVTDHYGPRTTTAVRDFQTRHRLTVLGYVDRPTLDALRASTRTPTRDELANRQVYGHGADGTWTTARLDDRCRTGHVLCIDKTSRTLRWVVDGEVHRTMEVRFGSAYTPTREGVFHVGWKSRDHVSTLFHTAMPFAMFFSGGQAVHYSSDFAARGYAGASHGCVNVRDYRGIRWLFDQVRVGDRVVVFWS
ncbi:MAG: L,D-transpeptidase family protein [Actinomycetes bacterium]